MNKGHHPNCAPGQIVLLYQLSRLHSQGKHTLDNDEGKSTKAVHGYNISEIWRQELCKTWIIVLQEKFVCVGAHYNVH